MQRWAEWWAEARIDVGDFDAWLAEQGPDEWHLSAVGTSHDGDQNRLRWIVTRPECELSTALHVFWQGDPAYALGQSIPKMQDPDAQQPLAGHVQSIELMKLIAEQVGAGFYTNRNIAFPPPESPGDPGELERRVSAHRRAEEKLRAAGIAAPWRLPDAATRTLPGRPAQSRYSIEDGCTVRWNYELWVQQNPA